MIFNTLTGIETVSNAIRDAVAPVFLITGVGSLLGVLVNRLGRSIDRARIINAMNEEQSAKFKTEFEILVLRTAWIRRSIGLITLAALCVCLSITALFIEVKMGLNAPDLVSLWFIAAMISLIIGLLCFLKEISLASRELVFLNRDLP